MLAELRKVLRNNSNEEYSKAAQWFFKTGPGEYGEGDQFIGIKVPVLRKIIKDYFLISFDHLKEMLASPVHEERLAAVLILVMKYKKGIESEKEKIFKFYLKNRKGINNWDLIDLSAPNIVGEYLFSKEKDKEKEKEKDLLFEFAASKNIWERRIAVLATYTFIRAKEFDLSFKIIEMLLEDKHDLIHKAAGWMLREIGKRDLKSEENFLKKHYKEMPRTMLRYAIEKFPEEKRQAYLKAKI
ncbi:MAG TPA: DNA alkylation repair protein [Ignavibacteriaceae bacterium]|nr:DNA alkylation repair protein [Ignavibacteriaceae bacterium]